MRRLMRWFVMSVVLTSGLILLAGRADGWLLLYCGGWSAFALYALLSIDDDLVRERFHPPNQGADRSALRAVRLIALAHLVVGALDSGRFHLAPVPDVLRAISIAVMLAFSTLIIQAMRTNRFFSAVVRIQSDRGHRVIDQGPYALIRHPGYLGMVMSIPFSGLALGSWLSFAIGLVYSALILRRVKFEDAFLAVNLPGYREYASRVRYRLIPGAW
jgi:protein-S-isoprenylcysteine O-methyltransferase Ste14